MAKYFLTNKAVEDLSNIWSYTKIKWSENQADKYYHFLLDICQEVADNPKSAKEYNQITNGLLGIRANRHVIFFRSLSKNEIEITRILHGKMDLKKRIKE
jgi:toxin ParE1/3/4